MNTTLAAILFITFANDAPDIQSVEADLEVPSVESGPSAPGKRIQESLPGYSNTNVYHVTYLPVDWQTGRTYPVLIEYAGNGNYENQFGDISTGRVEDSKLGYGITAGRGTIWVCLPYLNSSANQNVIKWWGDPPDHDPQTTIAYCKQAVPWICAQYGGDLNRVALIGFSRGAIACNFIGLHDAEIARLWCAFVPFSHYDGVVAWSYRGSDRAAAQKRLRRIGKRPQFICAEEGDGQHSVAATRAYLRQARADGDFTFRATGFRNHNDEWILRPSETRRELRNWMANVFK